MSVLKSVLVPYEKYQRLINKSEDSQAGTGLATDTILSGIPKNYNNKVKAILTYIDNDSAKLLRWNDKGELLYEGHVIPGSHVADLLKDSQREHKRLSLPGVVEFYEGLKRLNVPRSLIGNVDRRTKYLSGHIGLPPGIPDKIVRRKARTTLMKGG